MKLAKTSLVIVLLFLSGCFSPRLPDINRPEAFTAVPPCLASPLLEKAQSLASLTPEQNHVRLLEIGDDALLARIHLIRSARSSIDIQTMIWANDEAGRLLIFELIQAARRGVRVRFLIDHLASEPHIEVADFVGYLHPSFQIKMFNPVTGFLGQLKAEPSFIDKLNALVFKFDRLNRRMHNKTFIVDNLVGITGGRNYQNAYYDQAAGLNFKDRDILLVGPVVTEMKKSFDDFWNYKRSILLTELVDVKNHPHRGVVRNWYNREVFELNGLFREIDRKSHNLQLISQLFVTPLQAVEKAYFIADSPQQSRWSVFRSNGHSEVTEELTQLVSRAEESVYIQTPYLVLTTAAIKMFEELRDAYPSIDLQISTNSLAATDSWYVYALTFKQKKIYLDDLKLKIYEFKPLPGDLRTFMPNYDRLKARSERLRQELLESRWGDEHSTDGSVPWFDQTEPADLIKSPYLSMHGKSLVIDDAVSFVGSYNLDPRSENINTESGVVIIDQGFSRSLKEIIKTDMQPKNSWVIAKKKRPTAVNEANEILIEISSLIPLVDIWPIRNTSSFELKPGKAPVGISHPRFYKNYRDVGSFPDVGISGMGKYIGVRGTKMFLGFVKPLL